MVASILRPDGHVTRTFYSIPARKRARRTYDTVGEALSAALFWVQCGGPERVTIRRTVVTMRRYGDTVSMGGVRVVTEDRVYTPLAEEVFDGCPDACRWRDLETLEDVKPSDNGVRRVL